MGNTDSSEDTRDPHTSEEDESPADSAYDSGYNGEGASARSSDAKYTEAMNSGLTAETLQPDAKSHDLTNYAAVHFRRHDQLFVIGGTEDLKNLIRSGLQATLGVTDEKTYIRSSVVYLKLSGRPFARLGLGLDDAANLRRAAARVLVDAYHAGWVLVQSSNLTRTNSVDSWFLQKQQVTRMVTRQPLDDFSTRENGMLVISLSKYDGVMVLNSTREVSEALVQEILDNYQGGIGDVKELGQDEKLIRLKGFPWYFSGERKTDGVLTVVRMMALVEQYGYRFYGSTDFKGTSDALFFLPPDANLSSTIGQQHGFSFSDYTVLTLDDKDDLRIQNADEGVIAAVTEGMLKVSPCEREGRRFRNGYEWKLLGTPWWTSGAGAIAARRLLLYIFGTMGRLGYEHYATLDLSRKLADKSTIVFRRSPSINKATRNDVFAAVSPSSSDKLRLIDFSTDSPIHATIPAAVARIWKEGIKQTFPEEPGVLTMKLQGRPFNSLLSWQSECRARVMMCAVLAELNAHGYRLVSSCDLSAKFYADRYVQYPLDLNCWFVEKIENENDGTASAAPSLDQPPPYEAYAVKDVLHGEPPAYKDL